MIVGILAYILPKPWCLLNNRIKVFGFVLLMQGGVDFEYEGEMTVDVALNAQSQAQYPFSRLSGPANILVVPARHSASISVKLMQEMAGATVIGPILSGVDKSIQICPSVATATDILNMAVLAACKVG